MMKKICNIELYELQFEDNYLLAFIDDSGNEKFTEIIPKKDKGRIYTSIIKQLTIFLRSLQNENISN